MNEGMWKWMSRSRRSYARIDAALRISLLWILLPDMLGFDLRNGFLEGGLLSRDTDGFEWAAVFEILSDRVTELRWLYSIVPISVQLIALLAPCRINSLGTAHGLGVSSLEKDSDIFRCFPVFFGCQQIPRSCTRPPAIPVAISLFRVIYPIPLATKIH